MKRNFVRSVLSVAIAMGIGTGCTHMVVDDPNAPMNANAAADPNTKFQQAAVVNMPVSSQNGECSPADKANFYVNDEGQKSEMVRIRATGYGAPPKAFYPEPQRRLMAMRAAKIDAYRSLAERVKGVQIWGGTTIGDMVVEKDRFRVYLDVHLSGARVIAENPNDDGTFETVVEMKIGPEFLDGAGIKNTASKPCNDSSASSTTPMVPSQPVLPGKISDTRNNKESFIPTRSRQNGSMADTAFYYSD